MPAPSPAEQPPLTHRAGFLHPSTSPAVLPLAGAQAPRLLQPLFKNILGSSFILYFNLIGEQINVLYTPTPSASESRVLFVRELGVVLHSDLGWELGHMGLMNTQRCLLLHISGCLFFFLAKPYGMGDLSSQTRMEPVLPAVDVHSPKHWTTREVSLLLHFFGSPWLPTPQKQDV